MQNKVVVLSTGGTIAMRFEHDKGPISPVSGQELVDAVPGLTDICRVEVREFSNIPSPHMCPSTMLELAHAAERALEEEDVLGVVITHGTDTLEETAFFLDLYVDTAKPI